MRVCQHQRSPRSSPPPYPFASSDSSPAFPFPAAAVDPDDHARRRRAPRPVSNTTTDPRTTASNEVPTGSEKEEKRVPVTDAR